MSVSNHVHQYWFNTLNKGDNSLYTCLSETFVINKFIVCGMFYSTPTQTVTRKYAVFSSVSLFYLWYHTILQNPQKSFFEIIHGNRYQKPRFDIDIEYNTETKVDETLGWKVVENIVSVIEKIFADYKVPWNRNKDLAIYQSDNPNKFSVHLVLTSWYHASHTEAAVFFKLVNNACSNEYDGIRRESQWIDAGVYHQNQQFRLLGSTKYGKTYFKRKVDFIQQFIKEPYQRIDSRNYESIEEHRLVEFEDSCLTHVSNANLLFFIKDEKVERVMIKQPDLPEPQLEDALNYIPPECVYREHHGPIIVLKRIAPSYCSVCQRVHEHENPYMFVSHTSEIRFYCNRDQNKRYVVLKQALAVDHNINNNNQSKEIQRRTVNAIHPKPHHPKRLCDVIET